MHIKSDITLTSRLGGRHSFTITPAMGVVKNWTRATCEDLIAKGAVDVTPKAKKSLKEEKAEPAE